MTIVDPDLLRRTAELAIEHLSALPERPAGARRGVGEVEAALGGPLPDAGVAPAQVVEELVAAVQGGLVASPGPRYFGFVTGGALPAALAADWLASAWDQNSFSAVSSPAAAAVEAVVAGWVLDLLGLPADAGVGLVTGAQMANVTGLAAARHAVLSRAGWDVGEHGLTGAPPIRVFAGAEAHVTVGRALRLLGLGARTAVVVVEADDQGRMRAGALAGALAAGDGPGDRLRAGGQRQHRRVRPARRDRRRRSRARRVGARRRRVRPVGGCQPGARAARGGRRARRLVGRPTATSGSTSPTTAASSSSPTPRRTAAAMGMTAAYLVRTDDVGALELRLGARGLAPGARLRRLRGAALARTLRRGRARRALLRPGPPDGRRRSSATPR